MRQEKSWKGGCHELNQCGGASGESVGDPPYHGPQASSRSLRGHQLDADAVSHLLAEGYMETVGELHGQGAVPKRQFDGRSRLPVAATQVCLVRRNHLSPRAWDPG